jgi:hypothetical protein
MSDNEGDSEAGLVNGNNKKRSRNEVRRAQKSSWALGGSTRKETKQNLLSALVRIHGGYQKIPQTKLNEYGLQGVRLGKKPKSGITAEENDARMEQVYDFDGTWMNSLCCGGKWGKNERRRRLGGVWLLLIIHALVAQLMIFLAEEHKGETLWPDHPYTRHTPTYIAVCAFFVAMVIKLINTLMSKWRSDTIKFINVILVGLPFFTGIVLWYFYVWHDVDVTSTDKAMRKTAYYLMIIGGAFFGITAATNPTVYEAMYL